MHSPETIAKLLHKELTAVGYDNRTSLEIEHLEVVAKSEGKDASLTEDQYALKEALGNVAKALNS